MVQSTSTEHRTCCVVGGGPAGVMAGLLLARSGVDTVVLEKHPDFLRDFRGDTVHPSTLQVLSELGFLEDFLKLPHQELAHVRAHIGDEEVAIADFTKLPTAEKFIAFMPQWDFLDFLVERARAYPSFEIRTNINATDVIEENGRVTGVRYTGPKGEGTIRTDLVIAADGRHSVIRERARMKVRDIGAPIDVLWLRLEHRPSDPSQSLGWVRSGRFLALIDRGEFWQIAFLVPKGGFETVKAKGIAAFREDLARTAPLFKDRVETLRSFDDIKLLSVKIDRLEKWWRSGLLCLGDSAHAMSPVGGVGINLAIQDAVAAANLLAEPLRTGALSDELLASVQRRRELPMRAVQAVQVLVQRRVIERALKGNRPIAVGPALRFLSRSPKLQRIPAYFIGVGVRPEHVLSAKAPQR